MAYKDLSVRERAALIRAGVQNGVTSLANIEKRYNAATDFNILTDYDMAGYLRENPEALFNHNGHYPDKYKLPNHATFSKESKYSSEQTPGGEWTDMGENAAQRWNFTPSSWQLSKPGYLPYAASYLEDAESQGTTLTDSQGRYPVINGTA